MALLDSLLGGSIGEIVQKVVGSFKLSPEIQAQITEQIEAHKFELAQLDEQLQAKLADDASANIQAEAKGNWYTSAARPTFCYVVELILLWNYFIAPVFHRDPAILPADLMVLFGTVICGYIGARTYEKTKGTD